MQNEQPQPSRPENNAVEPAEKRNSAGGPESDSEDSQQESAAQSSAPHNSAALRIRTSAGSRMAADGADSSNGDGTGARAPGRRDNPLSMFDRPSNVSPGQDRAETSRPHLAEPIDSTSAHIPDSARAVTPDPAGTGYREPMPVATAVAGGGAATTGDGTKQPESPKASEPAGLLDLADSEEVLSEVDSGDDGRFVLTNHRLIYQGRSSGDSVFSSAAIEDVTAIHFGRRERDSRSAWWGVVGLIAAVAVWQVTTNETVGAVAGAIVGGLSLLLLADYWFRPAGLVLRFGTAGGSVEGPVSNRRMRDAEQLAAMVQQIKQGSSAGSRGGPTTPPGGSPGLS